MLLKECNKALADSKHPHLRATEKHEMGLLCHLGWRGPFHLHQPENKSGHSWMRMESHKAVSFQSQGNGGIESLLRERVRRREVLVDQSVNFCSSNTDVAMASH